MYALLLFFLLAGLASIYSLQANQYEYTIVEKRQTFHAAGMQAYRTAVQQYLSLNNFTGSTVSNGVIQMPSGYTINPAWKNLVDTSNRRFIVYADINVTSPSVSAELARVARYSQLAGEIRNRSVNGAVTDKLLFSPAPDVIGIAPPVASGDGTSNVSSNIMRTPGYISLKDFMPGINPFPDLPEYTPVWLGTYP